MASIAEAKKLYPELDGLDDNEVVDVLHGSMYPDMEREQVAKAFGIAPPKAPEPPPQSTLKRVASDAYKSGKQAVLQLPGQLTGFLDIPAALLTGNRPITAAAEWAGEKTGFQPGKWADGIQLSKENEASNAEIGKDYEGIEGTIKDPNKSKMDVVMEIIKASPTLAADYATHPAYTLNQVIQSLPSMIAGGFGSRKLLEVGAKRLAEGLAGPVMPGVIERTIGAKYGVPLAAGAGEGGGQASQQMRQYKGQDEQKNAIAAVGSGLGDMLISGVAGRVAHKLGLETAETAMAGGAKRAGIEAAEKPMSAPRRIIGGAASEGVLQEFPQSALEQAFQNYADDKPLGEGVFRQAVEGSLAGAVMGAGANVRGPAPNQNAGDTLGESPPDSAVPPPTVPPPTGPLSRAANVAAAQGVAMGQPGAIDPANDPVAQRIAAMPPERRAEAQAAYDLLNNPEIGAAQEKHNNNILKGHLDAMEEAASTAADPKAKEEQALAELASVPRSSQPEQRGTFSSPEEAQAYISAQRRNASINLPHALPIEYEDGSHGVVTVGTPDYKEAEAQAKARRNLVMGVQEGDLVHPLTGEPFKMRMPAHKLSQETGGQPVELPGSSKDKRLYVVRPKIETKEPASTAKSTNTATENVAKTAPNEVTTQQAEPAKPAAKPKPAPDASPAKPDAPVRLPTTDRPAPVPAAEVVKPNAINVQDAPPASASTKTETAPVETPKNGKADDAGTTAAGAQAGSAAVEADGVAAKVEAEASQASQGTNLPSAKHGVAAAKQQPGPDAPGGSGGSGATARAPLDLQAAALARIAKGTAYFGSIAKGNRWIVENGLKDIHTLEKDASGANKWNVVAKAPGEAVAARVKDDAQQQPAAATETTAPDQAKQDETRQLQKRLDVLNKLRVCVSMG